MAKLVLTHNDSVVGEYALNKDCLTIGRRPDNDIQVDNLAVSGHHAQVITILNDSFIEDLGSTNGTLVNAAPIVKHALRDGDVISIGKHQLSYVNELGRAGQGDRQDFEQTLIIRPDAAGMPEKDGEAEMSAASVAKLKAVHEEAAADAAPAPPSPAQARNPAPPPPAPLPAAKLQLLSGANTGKSLSLTKALTTLGKPGVQVAAVSRRPRGYFLIHVEGGDQQRPRVNGEPIGVHAHPLQHQDVIEISGIKMEFTLES
jgi:pSer/pThr/pTyr-binding forkhead associated (FHA) protein